jgi:hypothetical protein
MKRTLILIVVLAVSPCAFAQGSGNTIFYQSTGPVAGAVGTVGSGPASPVLGAPYSATITNELVQTLADGNRIVQTSTGSIARDSQGRTRQDAPLPAIGGLAPANAPRLVFIQDPVAQVSYTLNLTDKTAQKISTATAGGPGSTGDLGPAGAPETFFLQVRNNGPTTAPLPPPPVLIQNGLADEKSQVSTENLGSQTFEGVFATGVRTTRTIPAGEIGNEQPIRIVTEVWTSADLKTIVYSKRSDPRIGEQTFKLTNITRAEPDPSLFTVPADFQVVDGSQPVILYRPKQ